jgi:hypothetical protein
MARTLLCLSVVCLFVGLAAAYERVVVCEEAYQED